jgi:hypothetical protein
MLKMSSIEKPGPLRLSVLATLLDRHTGITADELHRTMNPAKGTSDDVFGLNREKLDQILLNCVENDLISSDNGVFAVIENKRRQIEEMFRE